MKKSFCLGAILLLAGAIGIRAQTNWVARIHFAGAETI